MANIFKYKIPSASEPFELRIRGFQEVVHVGEDGVGTPCIWAQVNPSLPEEPWTFMLAATGQEFDTEKWCHVKSFVQGNGLVWHLLRPYQIAVPHADDQTSTLVYVVATKRADGRLPNLEKTSSHKIHFTYADAEAARQLINSDARDSFAVFSVYCIVQQEVTFEVPF